MRRSRRPLVVLLTADAFSMTGNMLTTLAVPWFVLQTTGSAARTGLAAFVSTLPIVISAAFAGALVDRIGHRRASVVSDVLSGLIVMVIPALFLTTGLPFGVLLALLFVRWLLATPGETARQAMVPDLAIRGGVAMERATAAQDGVFRGARMIGAPLAGVLIVWLGPTALLFVDAATFLISAVLIRFGVPRPARDLDNADDSVGYLRSLREGLAFLWRERVLRAVVAMVVIGNMLDTGLTLVLLPVYASDVLDDPRALGLLLGAGGAGAVAGTIVYGAIGARLPRRLTYAVCITIGLVTRPLLMAAGVPLGMLLAACAVAGFAIGAINPLMGVVEYERIPERLRARVLGAVAAGCFAGMPLGGLLAGALTEAIGLTATLLGFCVIYLLVCLPPFFGKVWRGLDAQGPSLVPTAERA